MSKQILEDAIAHAKAVKTIAIANAKIALDESFHRTVTGMFEDKIKEELASEHDTSGIGDGTKPDKQSTTVDKGLDIEKFFEEDAVAADVPGAAPVAQTREHRPERHAVLRDRVVHARRYGPRIVAVEDPVVDHLA